MNSLLKQQINLYLREWRGNAHSDGTALSYKRHHGTILCEFTGTEVLSIALPFAIHGIAFLASLNPIDWGQIYNLNVESEKSLRFINTDSKNWALLATNTKLLISISSFQHVQHISRNWNRWELSAKTVNLDVLCLRIMGWKITHMHYLSRCSKHHVEKSTEGGYHFLLHLNSTFLPHIFPALTWKKPRDDWRNNHTLWKKISHHQCHADIQPIFRQIHSYKHPTIATH